AITAAAIACGEGGEAMVDFYREHARNIFKPREPYKPSGWLKSIYPICNSLFQRKSGRELGSLFQSRYCPHALRESLDTGFEGRRLTDMTYTRFITPTVNLSRGRSQVFRTHHFPIPPSDSVEMTNPEVVDILMASTAAPTYFPHATIAGEDYADGGLWAINPSILAIAEAMKIRQFCTGDYCAPHFDTSGIYLLSIGTGNISYSLSPPGGDAGALFWAGHAADIMSVSQVQGVQAPLRFLLADRFYPVNFELPDKSWSLDGIEHMEELFALGREEARRQHEAVSDMFGDHKASNYLEEAEPAPESGRP
ncbi:MAG: patatin-like phospholipase family protein, partial [Planctomycetota bacterium]